MGRLRFHEEIESEPTPVSPLESGCHPEITVDLDDPIETLPNHCQPGEGPRANTSVAGVLG